MKQERDYLSYEVEWYNMNMTLANLNEYFANNDSMTLKKFMDIQLKTWQDTKQKYGIKLKGE